MCVHILCFCVLYVCVCVSPPQKAPLCAVLEAAFLIRGHYMRLVRGSPGRGEGIRAQIRPSRPLTVPGHRRNETRPPPPYTLLSSLSPSRRRKREADLQENTADSRFSVLLCVFICDFVCVCASKRVFMWRERRYVPRG